MKENKFITLLSLLLVVSTNVVAKNITAKEFASLSPKEAVLVSHDWHRKGDKLVIIKPNSIEATFEKGEKVSIPLESNFFVSIAPYVNYTHKCTYHVPTGCTGELINKNMHINIIDKETGKVVADKEIKTQHDGFVDLWLKRDKDYLVSFNYNGKKASDVISTYKDDITCITTMHLN